jgi:methionyl-tRNA formyltransferase
MMHIGAELLLETVEGLAANSLHEIPQSELIHSETTLRHAPKIFTETCRINWSNPANDIDQLIRGMNPYPGAFTIWEDKKLKIWAAEPIEGKLDGEPGKWHTDKKNYLHIEAGDGLLNILELQAEGKKRMPADAFLRGIRWD